MTFPGLAVGGHSLQVRAVDNGVVDPTPASYSWTIDLTSPDTTITSGPSGTVASTSASFTFTSTETPATFECSPRRRRVRGLHRAAPTFTGLGQGAHTLSVRAVDSAGNADPTPSTRALDRRHRRAGHDHHLRPDRHRRLDLGVLHLHVDREPGDVPVLARRRRVRELHREPELHRPRQGAHTLAVRAIDSAGNVDASPASRSWTVDTVAPDTTIASGPTGTVASTSAAFTFTATESPVTYQCSLDGARVSRAAPRARPSPASPGRPHPRGAGRGLRRQRRRLAREPLVDGATPPPPRPAS